MSQYIIFLSSSSPLPPSSSPPLPLPPPPTSFYLADKPTAKIWANSTAKYFLFVCLFY